MTLFPADFPVNRGIREITHTLITEWPPYYRVSSMSVVHTLISVKDICLEPIYRTHKE